MRALLTAIITCSFIFTASAQQTFKINIRDKSKNPLTGATVVWKEINQVFIADSSGTATIVNMVPGKQNFTISYTGFEERNIMISFPTPDSVLIVELEEKEDEEEEVVITATRTSRTIANTPTRTEVISGEELSEKGNMKPGDIRMLLNESTGIQTQQTSATSFNAGIRIQGLDGRYTQILRDGYPLYSGFSGGLSILQIAPLDLKQVEVIKGSSSTLYGGGAIAGLVNLVSKTPGKNRELNFLANGTSARGLDLSGFYSERYGKAGLTIFGSRNSNAPFDPAGIGLTAIPKFERYTINPRLFLYGKKITADMGFTYITEDRIGGSLDYIRHKTAGFFEENNTDRITTQIGLAGKINSKTTLQFKNSYSRFNRDIIIPSYRFEAVQQSSFSELTWNYKAEKADWVIGTNFITDDLSEKVHSSDPARDYHYKTYGVFIQNAWSPEKNITLESGLRGDYVSQYGFELLPRVSALFKISSAISTRVGGGYGYKTPTVFTEESERRQFQKVLPVSAASTQNERSLGANWDINYRRMIGKVSLQFNHLFFYTRLRNPLVLNGGLNNSLVFTNADGHFDTQGMETNLRLIYHQFKLFLGYTYTDANTHFSNTKSWLPLTARNRLNNVLMYEVEDKIKLGLEAYYYSRQKLNDGTIGRSYWITGFMAEKFWEKYSVFINFENFTNTRQTKFDKIYTGSIDNPIFKDIYAPVEGFVLNGGFKIKL